MVLKTLPTERYHVEAHELRNDPHHLGPLIRETIRFTRPERILDATAGSGLVSQVADDEAIPCTSIDLHDPDAPSDLFNLDEPNGYDLVILHPDLWRARPDADHPHDLGATMTWDAYVELVRDAIVHLANQLRPGGHLVLVAPVARYKGRAHTLSVAIQCLLGSPAEPEIQHPHPYCRSRGTMYGKRFVPIAHDDVLLYKREEILTHDED